MELLLTLKGVKMTKLSIDLTLPKDNATELVDKVSRFFSKRALDKVFSQKLDSAQTVVFLTPDQYLNLIEPGDDYLTIPLVKGFIDKNSLYTKLPYLGVETDSSDGSVYVSMDGRDHEGRRIMLGLQALSIEKVPVIINSQQYDDGPKYKWGQTKLRPKTIEGYNDFSIPFPQTFPY